MTALRKIALLLNAVLENVLVLKITYYVNIASPQIKKASDHFLSCEV